MVNKKIVLTGILLIGVLVIAGCSSKTTDLPVAEATMFKSPTCGCCGIYGSYMEQEGVDLSIREMASLDSVKAEHDIPSHLQSCHTIEMGGYFIEGHMPMEAIEKLLVEQPDIAGIALPGMPQGSPGMPGAKSGDWVIYAVHHDGTYTEFMTV